MLVKVTSPKLVLSRNVYKKGDVFECRDAEAKLLLHARFVERTTNKANKSAPQAAIGLQIGQMKPSGAAAAAKLRTLAAAIAADKAKAATDKAAADKAAADKAAADKAAADKAAADKAEKDVADKAAARKKGAGSGSSSESQE